MDIASNAKKADKVTPMGCIGVLVVLGAVGLGIYSCASRRGKVAAARQTPKVVFEQVAKDVFGERLHKAEWSEFQGEEGNHMVWFDVAAASEGAFLSHAGDQMKEFLEKLRAQGGIRKPMGMTFLLMAQLQDQHGQRSLEKVLNISYSAEWLAQAQPANMSGYQVLDAAQSVSASNRAGGDILQAHLADPDMARITPRFNEMVQGR